MRLGLISFQANDNSDVFHVAEVWEDGLELSDEAMLAVEDAQFDSSYAWVTGRVPQVKPIQIEGDTAVIHAWLRGEVYDHPIEIKVYLECEQAEEFMEQETETDEHDKEDDGLEPQEIEL